ncbi:MAG TPA: FHA domain-containing protein [Pseudonocardiaceae bacterium]|nr:FHA domain-containing protein [Pseudonocardiaceae bacterium]
MSKPGRLPASGVQLLPAGTGSLVRGLPPVPAGTLFVLGDRGGISVAPTARLTVIFGRNEPEVHVCVGAGDRGVSRRHGRLCHDGRRWTVHNTGHLPIRLPGSQLLLTGHQEPLPVAYTPLFIRSGRDREHLLEVRVTGPVPTGSSGVRFDDTTHHIGTIWELSDRERLVLVALGQRYLRHEAYPQPLSWSNVAVDLATLQPGEGWTPKRAEHVAAAVRARLSGHGVAGLTRNEVGEPVGNALNHNLILELLLSTTLVPPDLRLLD